MDETIVGLTMKRACPSNKSWVSKKGVKNGGFCRVLPGKKRSFQSPAPKMRQATLNLPPEPASDYRGELLSVGVTSAVLGALGGSVAAALLLTPKGSGEAFRNGQKEAAFKFEKERAELTSKYEEKIAKLTQEAKKVASPTAIDPKAKEESDRVANELAKSQAELSKLQGEHKALQEEHKSLNDRLTQLGSQSQGDPDLEKEKSALAAQVSELSEQLTKKGEELQASQLVVQSNEETIAKHVEQINTLKANIGVSQSQLEEKEQTIAEHLQTIKEKDAAIDKGNSDLSKASVRFGKIVAEHQKTINDLKLHIEDLESQVESARVGNTTISPDLEEAKKSLEEAQSKLKGQIRLTEEYRKKLDEYQQLEKELKIGENENGAKGLKDKILQIENELRKAQNDAYASDTHGLSTHLTGQGVRERYGGIQLKESVVRKQIDIDTITEASLNAAVRNATRNLFIPLESKVFYPSNDNDHNSFLSEWEDKHNDVLEQFKKNIITVDQFWAQIATSHYQHTQRRQYFNANIEELRKSHSDSAAKSAKAFLSEYKAASTADKKYNLLKKYDRVFKKQYQEIKKNISVLQEKTKQQYPLDTLIGSAGEVDDKAAEAMLRREYSQHYLDSVLFGKRR